MYVCMYVQHSLHVQKHRLTPLISGIGTAVRVRGFRCLRLDAQATCLEAGRVSASVGPDSPRAIPGRAGYEALAGEGQDVAVTDGPALGFAACWKR